MRELFVLLYYCHYCQVNESADYIILNKYDKKEQN